jgi:CRISPR-associated protein Cmr3
MRPTLVSAKQEKPKGGVWLRQAGLAQHLAGTLPSESAQLEGKHLYQRDPRLGIGLNEQSRTAEDGLIYTTEGFAFSPAEGAFGGGTGFLVGLTGVHALLPTEGTLRLGGDGRSAHYRQVDFQPPVANGVPSKQGAFRLILQTPALFAHGWLPDGVIRQADGSHRLQAPGFSARLACAAVGRREVVSGWDLHHWAPKPAQAAVPAGSVYWFDQFEGSPDKLAAWVQNGLCPHTSAQARHPQQHIRRAEGYNCALLAAWNHQTE